MINPVAPLAGFLYLVTALGFLKEKWSPWPILFSLPLAFLPQELALAYSACGIIFLFYLSAKIRRLSLDAVLRQRAKLMLLAIFVTALVAAAAFFLGNRNTILLLAAFPVPAAIGYGSLHYNLFEVDEIIKQSILYSVTLLLIAALYGLFLWFSNLYLEGLIFSQNRIVILLSAIFFLFYFRSLERPVKATIDHLFFRKKSDSPKVLAKIRDSLASIMDLDSLVTTIKGLIQENLAVKNCELLLVEKIPADSALLKPILEKKRFLSSNEMANNPRFCAEMARLEAAFIEPVFFHEKMIGLLVIGKPQPGTSFTLSDIALLNFLANQAGVAIENARLFDSTDKAKRELSALNQVLEKKVKERTFELQERSAELETVNQKVALATRYKGEYLSSMSHELRTPLNGILGFADLILEKIYGDIPEKVSETLLELKKNGQTLLKTINNILDYSKIDAGKLELQIEDFSPKEIVESVVVPGVETSIPDNLPIAKGDSKRIKQILTNLIDNAVKYAGQGKISVSAAIKDNNLVFEVKDTGPGIPPERIEKIFTQFEEPNGRGLGLALSRKLAELHKGKLTVQSKVQRGSVFTVSLPFIK